MPILHTPRLTIRVAREADAAVMTAYRSDPEIAKYQDWDMPYDAQRGLARLGELADVDDIVEGSWVSFAIELDGAVIGDVVACVRDGRGIAEIGFTLAPSHHGHGYAIEAAAAMVDHLLEHHGVHRIEASLDPENVASMRVLEAIGMRDEGIARSAYLVRGEWVDDLRFAMTADDRAKWLARPRTSPTTLELVEITPDDAYLWGRLRTHRSQERFVSPMALSFRDALFPEIIDGAPVVPWMRGVLADGERVAFVMLAEVTDHHPEPYLWRLLIDRLHQRRGIGSSIIRHLAAQMLAAGRTTLLTSWGEGAGSPREFYLKEGFVPTGELDGDETVGRLTL
jgi:RimJ/RimL family protein N-acetyltransferase